MKMIALKLTQISAFVALALALGSGPTPCFAGKTIGNTQGTMTATTPDSTLVSWPGESKPHHQIRADQSYTAESVVWVTDGKFNPHGQAVEIRRFFQTRTPGTFSLGPMLELDANTINRPANSPFNSAHQTQDYGPYIPDQSTLLSNSLSANDVYGVETIELIFIDKSVNPSTQTVIDYEKIDIYQPLNAAAANYFVQNFQQMIALNTATAAKPTSYGGDPPRAFVNTTQTIYPGAETWVVIYPGVAQTTPPTGAAKIPSTDATAPAGDNWQRNNVFMDLGNYVNGPGTYTLQMMQQSVYGLETFGNPASFNITKQYNVNSQLGLTK
jgi:hypothetical protein